MKINSLENVDVRGKKVFCRVDFNVPMHEGQIVDDTRIRAALPTIQYLVEQGAKVILASHMGRPKGQVREELRLTPVAERLAQLLGQSVIKLKKWVGDEVASQVNILHSGAVLLLENVRFDPREEQNDLTLAKQFADLADLYVNDAFGAAHRAHASTTGITQYLPSVAGFLLQKELEELQKAVSRPERPFTAIIGGAKVRDKIGVIEKLLDRVDNLIIGGGLSYTFTRAQGYEIGRSLFEADKLEVAKAMITLANEKNVRLFLPIDAVVAAEFAADAPASVVDISAIPSDQLALDIGPKTCELYAQIVRQSRLVLWNGPMGVFEFDRFAQGTNAIARVLADSSAYSIIGGGDSAAAIEKAGLTDEVNHISTGGGASLEFLEGKILPGVAALQDK